jgi:hypothetical protein
MQSHKLFLPYICNGIIKTISNDAEHYLTKHNIKFEYNVNNQQINIVAPLHIKFLHNSNSNTVNWSRNINNSGYSGEHSGDVIDMYFFICKKSNTCDAKCAHTEHTTHNCNYTTTFTNINENNKINLYFLNGGYTTFNRKLKKQHDTMKLITVSNDMGQLYMLNNGLIIYNNCHGYIYIYPDTTTTTKISTDEQLTAIIHGNCNDDNDNDDNDNKNKDIINITTNFKNNNCEYTYNLSESFTPIDNTTLSANQPATSAFDNIISWITWANPLNFIYNTQLTTKQINFEHTTSNTTSNTIVNSLHTQQTQQTQHTHPTIQYFFNKINNNIIKLTDLHKTVKILKPEPINIPLFINSIEFDENNGVKLSGIIPNTYKCATLHYNKFFIGANLTIV